MNKVGIYYAYWTHEWDVDFNIYVDKVADLGFDILEVNGGTIPKMSLKARKRLINHSNSRKVDLSYCIGLSSQYDLASEDKSVRKNGIKFLEMMAKDIGGMGGGKLSGIIYGCWPALLPEGAADKRPYLERSIASMKEAIKAAEDNDVVLNVEVVNRFEQFLLNTAEEAVEYVKQVNSPNIKILLDTFHMNIEEDTISAAINTASDYLGHVHIGENNRKPPGYGHIPWDELVIALKKINYQGWIVMEPFLMQGGQVGRDIRVWRNIGKGLDLDIEAGKAVQFIRSKLAAAI
jgi:D-psicose/D-tagatose/L-ribulose 3-epimerase